MNIQYLRYFIEVSKRGSLSKASQSLYVSQQGLSKAIKSLESVLGAQLLERSNQGIELTPEGKTALKRAKRIVVEYDALEKDIASMRADALALDGGGIRLVSSLICIVTIIDSLRDRGHLEDLVLRQAETEEALLAASDQEWLLLVDLPSHSHPVEMLKNDYEIIPVLESKMGVMLRRDLAPDLPPMISPEEAAKLPLALVDTETTRSIHESIFESCPPENVKLRTTNENELLRGMVHGRFAAITPSCHWEKFVRETNDIERFAFSTIKSDSSILIAFVRSKSAALSPDQKRFVNSVVKAYDN